VSPGGVRQDLPVVREDRLSFAVGGKLGGSSAARGPALAGVPLPSRARVASDIETAAAPSPGYPVPRPGTRLGCAARATETARGGESRMGRARWMIGPLVLHRRSQNMTGWILRASMRT